ncbi:hypothetical protein MNBD_CPR01-71 [hydrothermal vent metagenome]|uniref:Uncharacterized protein n=1 Tax=hydrothermal vent metagenome TaxID=652676 RepID=A0A3B0V6J1_9ZZZZ
MNLSHASCKKIGHVGERAAAEYLRRHKFRIIDRNIAHKTGELDIVAQKENVVHVIEVKSTVCDEFPLRFCTGDNFDPTDKLNPTKIRKVVRTGEWYLAEKKWRGEWQVDGVVVWLRRDDGVARVRYIPHIV